MADRANKVVLILFPGAIAYELVTAVHLLGAKFAIEVATPTGEDHIDASGLVYRAARAFADVDPGQCAAILVAGGGLLSIKDDAALNFLLRCADRQKAVLGAICAGPLALAQAGVLVGHRYTQAGIYPASDHCRWDGAEFCRDPVVVSDNIITALPEAHIDFGIELGKRLGVFSSEQDAERQRGFLRGNNDRDWSKVGPIAPG